MYNFEIIIGILSYLILGFFSLITTNNKPVKWHLVIIVILFWPIMDCGIVCLFL